MQKKRRRKKKKKSFTNKNNSLVNEMHVRITNRIVRSSLACNPELREICEMRVFICNFYSKNVQIYRRG